MQDWYVGQEIVCINDSWQDLNSNDCKPEMLPVKDQVYHIRSINVCCDDILGLHLVEIVRPTVQCVQGFMERYFEASCFRPVVKNEDKKTTDISIFKKMERPNKVKAPENV